MKPSITAVIIAKNEFQMLANCIETLRWCDEVVVIDNGSTDQTSQLAESLGARVVSFQADSFAQLRTKGLKFCKTDWIMYIDADERVTPQLSQEILVHMETNDAQVLRLRRQNFCYGFELNAGGWESDFVERVFFRTAISGWEGDIHESPIYEGTVFTLHHPLWHLTHRSTSENLLKSASWTPIEAKLLADANEPSVKPLLIWRKFLMEFFRRYVLKKGSKDGMVGFVEAFSQALNRALVYIQVWELQQKPPLSEKYIDLEAKIEKLWRKQA